MGLSPGIALERRAHVFHLLKPWLESAFKGNGMDGIPEAYSYAGRIGPTPFDPEQELAVEIPTTLGHFRIPKFSVTELRVVFSVLFSLFWLARLGLLLAK